MHTMDMAEVLFRAKLTREDVNNPWGFRLQGGVEYDKPLTLLKVVAESLAAKGGLHPGDIVVKLAGKSADDMTHKDAQEAIIYAGNNLEIIVERAEVTIVATTSPPTTTCDSTKTTISKTTSVTPSDTTVTDSPVTDTTAAIATENKPTSEAVSTQSSQSDANEHSSESIPDKDKNRTIIPDRTAVPSDSVNEKLPTTGSENSEDVPETKHGLNVNVGTDDTAGTKSITKVLENDKLAKESSAVSHAKQSEPVSKESDTETGTPSNSKHKHLDQSDNTPRDTTVRDIVDARPAGHTAVDDVLVSVPVCDNNQQATDKISESPVVQDVKGSGNLPNCIVDHKSSDLKQLKPVVSEALSCSVTSSDQHVSVSPTSTVVPDTDVKLNSIKTLHIDNDNKLITGHESELADIACSSCVSEANVSNGLNPPLTQTIDSIVPHETLKHEIASTNPCIISEPSVINKFQSEDVAVVQPETTTKMAPSSTSSIVNNHPDPSMGRSQPCEALSQAPHIPTSSQIDVTSSLTKLSSTQQPAPIAMVITDVPKVTIEASAIETTLVPCEEDTKSTVRSVPSTKKIVADSINSSFAEPGISHAAVSMPIPIPQQQSRDCVSRQTNAPAEEIIVAPKPSVQIMTPPEHRETIHVPTGDKRSEETVEEGSKVDVATPLVSHEMKDFSKTAPWRMHKQSGSTSQLNLLPKSSEQSILHPWRRSRSEEQPMSHSLDDRQLSAAEDRMNEAARFTPTQIVTSGIINASVTPVTPPSVVASQDVSPANASMTKPQSTLTYVGKRIESPPVSSPVAAGAPFFKVTQMTSAPVPAGRDVPPSERSNTIPLSHTTPPSTSDPNSMLVPSPTSEIHSPQPEEIHFQAAAPDLVDIPMPAVKEMVENLNKRLQAIAVQHPKIVEATDMELGLNFFKQTGTDLAGHPYEIYHDRGEQEIIIDTPPNPNFNGASLEDIKQRLFGTEAGLYQVFELLDGSPSAHRRRFSLPGGSVSYNRHNQRRVRFAEPPESSVIEIEPRKQRHRRLWDDDGTMSDMEDYSSASILAAKLDRIERENALSTASFQRHRNAKQRAQSISGDMAQTKPVETFREKVISFESLGEPKQDDVVLSSLKPMTRDKFVLGPGRSGSRGFSLSIGQNKPGSISLSLTHQRGSGQLPTQVALAVPSTEGHFSYTISPRTGSVEPVAIKYSIPTQLLSEPIVKTVSGEHVKAPSLDSARTVHIQYPPQEGVPTIQTQLLSQTSAAGPLSPQQQVMRQLAGRPGIRSPTNYSHTLQIDTSSRLQHRSPSPPHPSYPPTIQTDRSHLSPQRLVHPQARLPDTAAAEYQAQPPSSPSQGAPIGLKVRQPSPTNPMAYQRSTSPQGVPQYGPAQSGHPPSLQQASRQLGMPGVQYQQSTGSPGGTSYQPSSPRAVSPVSFQHQQQQQQHQQQHQQQQQPIRLQTISSLGHQRPVSPQGNLSLMVPASAQYQSGQSPVTGAQQPQMMMRSPQQMLQPPGYSIQQYQQPSPRMSPRSMQPPMGLGPMQVPRGPPGPQQAPPYTRDAAVSGIPGSYGPMGGQQVPSLQQISSGQPMPGGQHILSGQPMPGGQPIPGGPQMASGQPRAGGQTLPAGLPVSSGQSMPIGQSMPDGQTIPRITGGQATPGGPPPGVPFSDASDVPSSGPGLFALFDKRFTEKFLQWGDERPGDLCRSETYKLVHEMDEQSDDL